ncbi:MAG: hypothetical protein K2Y25_03940 [Pseudomonadaceae bacterium]|nr:hypothetical protein [Pseudomonadaceae bacterium]
MIPVPPLELFIVVGLLYLLSMAAGAGLLLMLLGLFFRRSRQHLGRYRKSYIGLSLLLLILLLPGVLLKLESLSSIAAHLAHREALNPRLEQALQLGELRLPAGSQVKLGTLEPLDWQDQPQPYGLASVLYAELSQPIVVLGLSVDAIDASPHSFESKLRLSGQQSVADWPCAAGSWVTFKRTVEARLQPSQWQFKQCTLAPHSEVAGVSWPADGRVYIDESGWELSNEQTIEPPLSFLGLQLRELRMKLDQARQLSRWEGELGAPLRLGDWDYPSGTAVRWQDVDTWLFSPTADGRARNQKTGATVTAGHSIQQRHRDGTTLGVFANATVGVIDWMGLEVTPASE